MNTDIMLGLIIGFIVGANFVIILNSIIKKIDEHNEMYEEVKRNEEKKKVH